MKKGYVYILKSQNCSRYYIGSTISCVKRLLEHNQGKVTATRGKGPWYICIAQEYDNIRTARKIEYRIKKMKSRILLEKMIKDRIIKLLI